MIKLLIVDDQKILLDGFVRIFSAVEDVVIVGSITLAELADVYCYQKSPDLVLMDICMESKVAGIHITRQLKHKYKDLKVVLMTGFPEISFVQRAKEAGADSFIYKDCSAEEFVQCIRDTMAGKHIYPAVSGKETFGFCDARLTHREMEILNLACRNLSRKEIAAKLAISESTVNFHVNNMLNKTGHKSIIGLAVEAANKGYVDPKIE